MNDIVIRPAAPVDLAAIRDILAAAYAPYLGMLKGLPDVSALSSGELSKHDAWIATRTERQLGVVLATTTPPVAHLANIAVHPDGAGQGLARALIEHVVEHARDKGCVRLDLATHPDMGANVTIYRRMGWKVTDEGVQKICMSRPL
jgi:ribosomal protein S18 acetylase RimI-like enzyme